jgi:hypothetical protein
MQYQRSKERTASILRAEVRVCFSVMSVSAYKFTWRCKLDDKLTRVFYAFISLNIAHYVYMFIEQRKKKMIYLGARIILPSRKSFPPTLSSVKSKF